MKLEEQLQKLSLNDLLNLLSKRTVEVLQHLNYLENITSIKLSKIIIKRYGENEFISNKKLRYKLISTLSKDEAKKLVEKISNKKIKENYKFLKNCKCNKNSIELKIFRTFFEIKETEIKTEIKKKETFEIKKYNSNKTSSFYPLFQHQITACNDSLKFLKSDLNRAFLHMPTGSGKTRTAINVMCNLLRENTKEFVIVWLAHTEELCNQAFTEFNKAWQILGNQDIKIFKHFGGEKSNLNLIIDSSDKMPAVLFSSLTMMDLELSNNTSNLIKLSKNIGLVIMDEAHMTTAKTYKLIIEILAPKGKAGVLGLSATPGRSYLDVNQDLELKDFYYGNKVTLKVEKNKNIINWLIKEKYLAKAEMIPINFEADLATLFTTNEINKEIDRIKSGRDYSKVFKDTISNNNERFALILDIVKRENKFGDKIIVFASSVKNAEALGDVLNIQGIKAESITSNTPSEKRRNSIDEFKNSNRVNILINYDVLTMGFDAPKAKVAIIARPTTSIVLYHQMIGRVSRGLKQKGNENCKILTVLDTYLPGFRDLSDSFYFWEDIWDEA